MTRASTMPPPMVPTMLPSGRTSIRVPAVRGESIGNLSGIFFSVDSGGQIEDPDIQSEYTRQDDPLWNQEVFEVFIFGIF